MPQYRVMQRYGARAADGTPISLLVGRVVNYPEDYAAWVNRDAPGTLVPVEPEPEPEPEPAVEPAPASADVAAATDEPTPATPDEPPAVEEPAPDTAPAVADAPPARSRGGRPRRARQ